MGLAQFATVENKAVNIARALEQISNAAQLGADIIVLPVNPFLHVQIFDEGRNASILLMVESIIAIRACPSPFLMVPPA